MVTERIGILGGTFDPVHVGHLMDASAARYQLSRSRVLVARDPWQRRHVSFGRAALCWWLLRLDCTEGPSRFHELEREGPTYMIHTAEDLAAPGRELFLVVGSDVAAGLPSWHRVDELRALVTLAIVDRDSTPFPAPDGWRVARVSVPRLDLTSTELRRRAATGEPLDFLVPTPAARILRAHGLYRS